MTEISPHLTRVARLFSQREAGMDRDAHDSPPRQRKPAGKVGGMITRLAPQIPASNAMKSTSQTSASSPV